MREKHMEWRFLCYPASILIHLAISTIYGLLILDILKYYIRAIVMTWL